MDSLPSEPPGKPPNTGVCMPMPSPGDLPDLGIEPGSPALQADSLPAELPQHSPKWEQCGPWPAALASPGTLLEV